LPRSETTAEGDEQEADQKDAHQGERRNAAKKECDAKKLLQLKDREIRIRDGQQDQEAKTVRSNGSFLQSFDPDSI